MIHYDGDGTYSYSFVTNMETGEERTFKLDASQDIHTLPESGRLTAPDHLDVYYDPNEIKNLIDASSIYSPLFNDTVLSPRQYSSIRRQVALHVLSVQGLHPSHRMEA